MNKGQVREFVISVLADHCGGTEVKSSSVLKDFFRDEVQETCFYTEVEITFEMNEIPKTVSDTFQTVEDLVKYIAEHQNEIY